MESTEERDNRLNDFWLRFFGAPILAAMAVALGRNLYPLLEPESNAKLFILMLSLVIVVWESNRYILLYMRRKNPGIRNTKQRILKTYVLYTLNAFFFLTVYVLLTDFFNVYVSFKWTVTSTSIFYCCNLLFTYCMVAIYEGIYFFRHWKRSTMEMELLKRESLQTQYESLKNQVNPHFLFNSLNSLSSLIEEDTDKAEQFVQEMSNVYRYLLQSNDKLLTTLKAEMDFINAYFFLLRTRFSENLKYEIDVPEKFLSWQIPPLTLQLLVENAVKHNIVSSGKPLTIKIYMNTDNLLVVTNNRQVKTQSVLSNKIGLNNISVKYKLLSQPDIMVEQTDTKFEVKLTLIPEDVIMGTTHESIIYSN